MLCPLRGEPQGVFRKYGCRAAASYEEVLKDPEVEGILLVTPHSTHDDMIAQAASAGKHVFVEKPLTLTAAGAKKAIADTSKAGVTLLVGHNRRRSGANRKIKEMIDSGALGQLHQLEANLSLGAGLTPRAGWRSDPAECPAGAMTGLGVHMIDNLHYLAGPVKRLFAMSKRIAGKSQLDDVTSIVLEFEGGPLGYIGSTYVIPKICTTTAFGTQLNAWSEEDGARFFIQKPDQMVRQEIPCQAGDSLAEEITEFAGCIRGTAKPETGGPESLEVVAVLEAVVESARTNQAVEISKYR
ncbi:MAG: Gfo/Idh/MocA family oxidoreductase [bacterium]|nr:Gfo/Idh/MocA family oxidoreductase [bacterium]